jgi:hypothetical protein
MAVFSGSNSPDLDLDLYLDFDSDSELDSWTLWICGTLAAGLVARGLGHWEKEYFVPRQPYQGVYSPPSSLPLNPSYYLPLYSGLALTFESVWTADSE